MNEREREREREREPELNVIYNENCLDGLKKLPDKSVDLILTDPPYGKMLIRGQMVLGVQKIDDISEIGIKQYQSRKFFLKCSE